MIGLPTVLGWYVHEWLIDIKKIKFCKICYLMKKNTINYIDGKF